MPGSVSDSYDSEFGTADNAAIVRDATTEVLDKLTTQLGHKLEDILDVCTSTSKDRKKVLPLTLTEREWRLIRFNLRRSLDSI